MVVWNIKLPDTLTNAECERGDVTKQGGVPPVRVVPPVKDAESAKKKSSVTFYVGEGNTVKETHEKFDSDEPEDGILFIRFFLDLLKKKGLQAQIEKQEQIRDDNTAHIQVMEEGDNGLRHLRKLVSDAEKELVKLTDEALDLFEKLLGNFLADLFVERTNPDNPNLYCVAAVGHDGDHLYDELGDLDGLAPPPSGRAN